MMDKREMSKEERVNLLNDLGIFMDIDAFTDAIVIECEVEHRGEGLDVTEIRGGHSGNIWLEDYHGTPGKALAIIVSLEETKP